jgi:hypothetical protein
MGKALVTVEGDVDGREGDDDDAEVDWEMDEVGIKGTRECRAAGVLSFSFVFPPCQCKQQIPLMGHVRVKLT